MDELTTTTVGSTTKTHTYDLDGNRAGDGRFTYTYDPFNRLRTVTDTLLGTQVAEYTYDVFGRRITKATPLATTSFVYDGFNVIEEYGATGILEKQFVHGDAPDDHVVMDRNLNLDSTATGAGDQRLYFVQDHLGSVTALADAAGNFVEGYLYEPYGKMVVIKPGLNGVLDWSGDDIVATTSAYANPYAYTGQRIDTETGLYYYKARYYDADAGRFLSRDPIGIWGDAVNVGKGYAYVGGSPTVSTDPTGLAASPSTRISVGRFLGDLSPYPLPADSNWFEHLISFGEYCGKNAAFPGAVEPDWTTVQHACYDHDFCMGRPTEAMPGPVDAWIPSDKAGENYRRAGCNFAFAGELLYSGCLEGRVLDQFHCLVQQRIMMTAATLVGAVQFVIGTAQYFGSRGRLRNNVLIDLWGMLT